MKGQGWENELGTLRLGLLRCQCGTGQDRTGLHCSQNVAFWPNLHTDMNSCEFLCARRLLSEQELFSLGISQVCSN